SEPTGGGPFGVGQQVVNCARAAAAGEHAGTRYSSTSAADCAEVTGHGGAGGGTPALEKTIGGTVREGGRQARTGSLVWGTQGRDAASVTVYDGDAIVDGVPGQGRTTSFWDTFDITRLNAIASGLTNAGRANTAFDPHLVFDQITSVEYFDTEEGDWRPVANAATPYKGSAALTHPEGLVVPDNVTLRPEEAAVAGGLRVTYEPLSDAERADVVAALTAAGDARAYTHLVSGRVVATAVPARELQVHTRLREDSRS